MPIIEVNGLVKNYNGTPAAAGVTFHVNDGEVFGFLGPNGAGKTTTINILCTLLNSDSGTAVVNGFDCRREPHKVRSSIGLVFQEMTLDNELTAYENLKFHCYLYNMEKRHSEKKIEEMLEIVGLSDRKKDLVKNFSGGMKRRLEIARGLLHTPKVLFLDEPTLGLDPQTRSHVWEHILRLKGRIGNTVFLTTHYMEEAEVCDRIAIIDRGRVIACGAPAELKASVRGDIVRIKTSDDEAASLEIEKGFGISPVKTEQGISFTIEGGEPAERFIPRLFGRLTVGVVSVDVRKPSLEDVFIKLTGREIRDGSAQPQPRGR
ncbi:MAG: ATP-binding cassette domain-containing protein [Deltaproteobacteria bacterium]